MKTDPLTWTLNGKVYSVEKPKESQEKVVEWETVAPKKKPKVVGRIPGDYDKHLLAKDKPETLDGQMQAAFNTLCYIDKRFHKAKTLAKEKDSK